MKKIMLLLMISLMVGCQNNTIVNETANNQVDVTIDSESDTVEAITIHTFATKEDTLKVLTFKDDYILSLSLFDYASKFNSEVVLDDAGREEAYSKVVLEWSDEQKANVDQAMLTITKQLKNLNMAVPEIVFGLTSNADEGGAAYTRANMIILKPHSVSVYSKGLEELIAHELFHVYSRLNKEKRPALYGIIGYTQCAELIPPESLKDLMISNPDAPDNNYYIEGVFEGVNYAYVPVIYSSAPYEIGSGRSFFETLHDDMLAVEIVNGVPFPVLVDEKPLIVKKDDIADFYGKIGRNTAYTYHPEETMADNFVFLLLEQDVIDQHIVESLREVLEE